MVYGWMLGIELQWPRFTVGQNDVGIHGADSGKLLLGTFLTNVF